MKILLVATVILYAQTTSAVTVSVTHEFTLDYTTADGTLDEVQYVDPENIKTNEGISELRGGTKIWINSPNPPAELEYLRHYLECTIQEADVYCKLTITASTKKRYCGRRARLAECVLRRMLNELCKTEMAYFNETGSFIDTLERLDGYMPLKNIRACRRKKCQK